MCPDVAQIDRVVAADESVPIARARESLVSIDVTTELRWFFEGPLPPEVLSWFTQSGTRGLSENRCDHYRHDDLVDIGVKRRFGTTLELKKRLREPEVVVLGALTGQLERWQRWSPADDRVQLTADTTWVDVEKSVIKRRFDTEGREVALSEETRAMSGQGCDAEVVELCVEGRPAWSIAFAGFGPHTGQLRSVVNAWDELMHATFAANIDFARSVPFGYPEWLVRVARRPEIASSTVSSDSVFTHSDRLVRASGS